MPIAIDVTSDLIRPRCHIGKARPATTATGLPRRTIMVAGGELRAA